MIIRHCFTVVLLLLTVSVFAQQKKQAVEERAGFLIPIVYKAQLPFADLGNRFGFNSSIGLGVHYKTRKTWQFGIEGGLLFGDQVKDEDDAIQNSYIFHQDGRIFDIDGLPAEIFFFERGWTFSARVGKVILPSKNNPNSGWFAQVGVGFMSHRIFIDSKEFTVPFLRDEYETGIDRLTNGWMLVQYIGYQYLDRQKLKNFSIGIEIIEGFTRNRRSYNFITMSTEDEARFDLLVGLRVSWILPIYNRKGELYFN